MFLELKCSLCFKNMTQNSCSITKREEKAPNYTYLVNVTYSATKKSRPVPATRWTIKRAMYQLVTVSLIWAAEKGIACRRISRSNR